MHTLIRYFGMKGFKLMCAKYTRTHTLSVPLASFYLCACVLSLQPYLTYHINILIYCMYLSIPCLPLTSEFLVANRSFPVVLPLKKRIPPPPRDLGMPSLIATGANQALLSELLGKYKEASFQKSLQEARGPMASANLDVGRFRNLGEQK